MIQDNLKRNAKQIIKEKIVGEMSLLLKKNLTKMDSCGTEGQKGVLAGAVAVENLFKLNNCYICSEFHITTKNI